MPDYTIAAEATKRISEIFHLDGQFGYYDTDHPFTSRLKDSVGIPAHPGIFPAKEKCFSLKEIGCPLIPTDGL